MSEAEDSHFTLFSFGESYISTAFSFKCPPLNKGDSGRLERID